MLTVFFNDTATTEIYTLSLHDALPISTASAQTHLTLQEALGRALEVNNTVERSRAEVSVQDENRRLLLSSVLRSEEHTSELQSLAYLVCRLLLEKKNTRPQCADA